MASVPNLKYREGVAANDWTTFRTRLKALTDGRGMLNVDLAKALNISASSISRWYSERGPDLTSAWILADFFNVSIDWIVGRTDERYSVIPEDFQQLLNKYETATPTDRLVIDTLLSKYE